MGASYKVPEGMNTNITLLTGGEIVVTGRIPLFKMLPNVILWGTRVFQHQSSSPGAAEYEEIFYVYMVDVDPPQS